MGLGHVGVAGGGRQVAVAEQALDGEEVDAGFQQVRGVVVPQGVQADLPGEAGPLHRLVAGPL
jgi:hypothetical protein